MGNLHWGNRPEQACEVPATSLPELRKLVPVHYFPKFVKPPPYRSTSVAGILLLVRAWNSVWVLRVFRGENVDGFASVLCRCRSAGSQRQTPAVVQDYGTNLRGNHALVVFWESVPTAASTPGILARVWHGDPWRNYRCLDLPLSFTRRRGMLKMKTGLPLAVVGTSTYGVLGGFLLPGFLMGTCSSAGWRSTPSGRRQLLCTNTNNRAYGYNGLRTLYF